MTACVQKHLILQEITNHNTMTKYYYYLNKLKKLNLLLKFYCIFK